MSSEGTGLSDNSPTPHSLLGLPTELLLEIISYYHDPFTFFSPLVDQKHAAQEREVRVQILRSLSQTCSALRSIFLPSLWERLHASGASFEERYTESALKTLIFPYIKSVHISMRAWSSKQIVLFVQLLRALPNLSGLQIYHAPSGRRILRIMSYGFQDAVFPGVTALCVPEYLSIIFPSFPNVTALACPSIYAKNSILPPAKQYFPRLEALGGLRLSKELIEEVLGDFPTLRSISISSTISLDSAVRHRIRSIRTDRAGLFQDLLPLFKRFKHLCKLSLVHEDIEHLLLSLENLIAGGRDVLRASDSQEVKELRVWSYDVYKGFNVAPCVILVND
ncbi:hypothetical protein C8R44DRAFT_144284 [Mycena epipterygia]|nr:hypothetical protein C8R44DRAFT_144284 [Mycena epipterygia]